MTPRWTCAVCGGSDVHVAYWVAVNTDTIGQVTDDDPYCTDCDAMVTLDEHEVEE